MVRMKPVLALSPVPLLAALLPLVSSVTRLGNDWPQYNGAGSDRTSVERVAVRSFDGEPPVAWRTRTNLGFSSFSVGGARAFTLVSRDSRETCVALDAASGEELWAAPLSEAEYDGGGDSGADGNQGGDGPRSTPSVDDGRVYCLDSRLVLWCLEAATGQPLWKRDIVAEHAGRLIQWQSAASPLLEGDLVYVAGGGPDQSLLAIDKSSGETRWKVGDERMTHATPIAATIHGVRQVIFFVQSGLVAVAPVSGEILWRIPYNYRTSTAASPVVEGDIVYCSAGYGVGAGAFRITKEGDTFGHEVLWRKRNKLMNHWSTPVARDGFLYGMFGFKKYGEAPLACVELATGETRWSEEGFGPGNVILVDDVVVALSDTGEVVLVVADPDSYREQARADVLDGKCWSSPAYSDGRLFVRSTREAVRIDLGPKD
jgi:outer membrane protein assembly factor BamB